MLLSVALAAATIGAFGHLTETAVAQPEGGDRESLLVMGMVVGSWGAIIALFSLTSTLGITLAGRKEELGLLRTIGGTPRQVRRLVRTETVVVTALGLAVGGALAWLGGRGILHLLQSEGMVADRLEPTSGAIAIGVSSTVLLVVSLVSTRIAVGRVTRGPARGALAESVVGSVRMPWWRWLLGLLLMGLGLTMGALTATVMSDSSDPYAPMQTAGSAGLVTAVGVAVIAPAILRLVGLLATPFIGFRPTGHLASSITRRRPDLLGGVLGPVTVFVATTTSVFVMVGIDARTLSALVTDQQEADTVTLLNYVVTGMIAVFAGIMLINSLVAVTSGRKEEFNRLQLIGSTRRQVRGMVRTECILVAACGIVLGLLASLVTALPYAFVRDEGWVPDGGLWVPLAMSALAVVMTFGAASMTVRRTLTEPSTRTTTS